MEVSTQENQDFISESNQKTPKVIVTEKSFNSFTLSFDHFAPIEEYNHGYVALYKRANESQWQTEKGKEIAKNFPKNAKNVSTSGIYFERFWLFSENQ